MNGAQAMVKCLENEGVEMVFGYPGVAICPFYDSLLDTDIKSVLIRTEQNAAHAASGLARVTGKVGVCAVTSGPGATNLITGIATAFADSIPLVCITGQVNSELIGSDVFQEADITGAAESFVKYSYLVKNAEDIPQIFKEAFYIANTGRKGPVLIDVPIDVQNAPVRKFKYPDSVSMRTYKPTVKGHIVQIKKVIAELEKAKRPVICAGGGVLLGDAQKLLREFSPGFTCGAKARFNNYDGYRCDADRRPAVFRYGRQQRRTVRKPRNERGGYDNYGRRESGGSCGQPAGNHHEK